MKLLVKVTLLGVFLLLMACHQSSKTKSMASKEMDKQPVERELKPRIIKVNGVNLHYVEKGKGNPVVFVHGAFGDYRTFHNQMGDFSHKYRAISYSRRYYHPNNIPIDSISDFSKVNIDDLASFIQSLSTVPVHLVGHSSGAWIALQTTIQHPELIKTLTLGEPPAFELLIGDPKRDSIMNIFQTDYQRAIKAYSQNEDKKGTKLFLEMATGDAHFFDNLPVFDQKIIMDNIAERKASLLAQSRKADPVPLHCSDIKNIRVPVLLVGGGESPGWVGYIMDKLEACIENKNRVILPNTTHGLEYQNPEAFNRAVLQFIGEHEK
ncbi:alpha/beta fold hydrolase [Galbibacter pacificus]|uniref:Alpha/beta hydrolase n=1 Tax=Galbibacter pacificus TaxID=2996052 RepID=A0ABT6FV95_9FLAO|nr:alpha/beta hydrolase [Galbibacter pacificus]MDG3583888.1 alpha/beta hydrolase [Galbibacter pacificus]MDG3587194.1 alpha/beta hydrolase [Galbibacter pacificus]